MWLSVYCIVDRVCSEAVIAKPGTVVHNALRPEKRFMQMPYLKALVDVVILNLCHCHYFLSFRVIFCFITWRLPLDMKLFIDCSSRSKSIPRMPCDF